MDTREVGVSPVYEKTQTSKAKTIINVGGARSSKSYSIAQLLIQKLVEETGKTIGICRKTFPSLRMTTLKLMLDLLIDYGIYRADRHNKTSNTFTYKGNIIQFFSLDEPEKIKSAEFNYIWMEEANEFTYEDYTILKLRLSGPVGEGESNHIYLSLNPIDESNWIARRLIHETDVEVIHSTYLDNKWLDNAYVEMLKNLINEDENFYNVYVLGRWGKLENLVYRNWKVVDQLPEKRDAMAYGLDFGYVNPSVIVQVSLCNKDMYIDERLYQAKLTNQDIIEALSHEERGDIYADPTELQMIEEVFRAGYNIYPASKDVKAGLGLCKRQTLYITKGSVNIIKEIQGYQHKRDKNGYVMEDPVKFNDHGCDAFRYAVGGLVERYGYATSARSPQKPITKSRLVF